MAQRLLPRRLALSTEPWYREKARVKQSNGSRLWAYRGKVASAKLGSRLMIPTSELDRIIAENPRPALEDPQSAPALLEERLADAER